MRSTSKIVLEIEQKFAINDGCSHVETRLAELGFSKTTEIKMVDWYFDTPDWS
jgi:inorganic triphosphatase YgiF